MTLFWILVVAMTLAVLVVLLRPLLRAPRTAGALRQEETAQSNLRVLRAQAAELDSELAAGSINAEQHAAALVELEQRVMEEALGPSAAAATVGSGAKANASRRSPWAAALLGLALPALALAVYLHLGLYQAADPRFAQWVARSAEQQAAAQAAGPAASGAEGLSGMSLAEAVEQLAQRMKADPADPNGWALLGRSYVQLGRFPDARDAFLQAQARLPQDDAQLLADVADATGMAQGRTLVGAPEALIARALKADPRHLKTLALAGSVAMEKGDFAGAVAHWSRALEVAQPGSAFAEGLSAGIAEARQRGGLPAAGSAAVASASAPQPGAATASALRVTVRLAPELAAQLKPGEQLVVFARAAEGPRMPLAVARVAAGAQPVQVVLDDSQAMTPQARLSAFAQVIVGARVPRSGQGAGNPQPGDFEGETAAVASSGEITLLVNRVRP
jgi:cytochrome c-type biogenesis protein CcmH